MNRLLAVAISVFVSVWVFAGDPPTFDYSSPPYDESDTVYRPSQTVALEQIDALTIRGTLWELGSVRPDEWEESADYLNITNWDLALSRVFWYRGVTVGNTTFGWNVRGLLLFIQTTDSSAQLPTGIEMGDSRDYVVSTMGAPTFETPLGIRYRHHGALEDVMAYFGFDSHDLLAEVAIFVVP